MTVETLQKKYDTFEGCLKKIIPNITDVQSTQILFVAIRIFLANPEGDR
jgi:hypothetical protein